MWCCGIMLGMAWWCGEMKCGVMRVVVWCRFLYVVWCCDIVMRCV